MGLQPISMVPMPRDPALWWSSYVRTLERDLSRRRSRLGWRRRRAYAACLGLIRHREAMLDVYSREIEAALRPEVPEDPRLIRGGAGMLVAAYERTWTGTAAGKERNYLTGPE